MTDVKQLPEAFLKEMEQLLGDEYEAYIKSYEEAWKPGLRVNTLKIMPEEFKNLSHLELTPVDWTEKGFYYEDTERPARHPFYYAGLYYLQEPSAMAPAAVLPVEPGDKVLDVCAAPGGNWQQNFREKECLYPMTSVIPGQEHYLKTWNWQEQKIFLF